MLEEIQIDYFPSRNDRVIAWNIMDYWLHVLLQHLCLSSVILTSVFWLNKNMGRTLSNRNKEQGIVGKQ